MQKLGRRSLLATAAASFAAGCLDGGPENDEKGDGFEVETVTDGLSAPWGTAFLPDRLILVTERVGNLLVVDRDGGETQEVDGVPDVHDAGQGGMLDVAVHPDYGEQPWVYLTYSATDETGASTTHLGRGRLDADAGELDGFEVLHAAEPFVDSTQHYGSRVVFGDDGDVYFTVGDRGFKDFGPDHVSQDTENELGATLRLEPDGSVPDDNPFVDQDGFPDSVYSYGHRNSQGMTVHPETGELWQSEHGERDGDEINVVERGGNYGWPVTHYGCEYGTQQPVGDQPHEREDTVDPVYYWECTSGGFPPAGAAFYDGDSFPEWRGDLFVGNPCGSVPR